MTDIKKDFCIMQTDYGDVWKVHDINKEYAATILWNRYDDYPVETKAELYQTLSNSKLYTHPYIQKTIDYSVVGFGDEKNITILNEYCADTLREMNLSLPYEQKIIHLYGIAEAMKYLHENNVLHYDLSTKTVLDDGANHPKLSQIGYSECLYSVEHMNHSPFTAPEKILQDRYDKKSEIYSYGMIVYEVMTEKIPFDGFNEYEIIQAITKNERPEFPPDSLSLFYYELINECWETDPDLRPDFESVASRLKEEAYDEIENDDTQTFREFIAKVNDVFH